jgi:hypothetical protein
MLNLTERGVDILIKRCSNFYWNNYDLVAWEKNSSGYFNLKGIYRNNSWGIANEFPVNSKGIWSIPLKHVRHFK